MSPLARILACAALFAAGCRRGSEPPAAEGRPPRRPANPTVAEQPPPRADPWEERGDFAFEAVPLPEAISRLTRGHRLAITVAPNIPVEEWSRVPISLRMHGVTRRALLDWLVRPLQAQYALECEGAALLTREDEPADEERLETRTYRVPTHLTSERPLRGLLAFEREQAAIVETLYACLRYLAERRPGCRLAFHGGQDVLAARLPARGHARLMAILNAMRYGSPPPAPPQPSVAELRERLDKPFVWDGPPGPANRVLFGVAELTGTNLGWPAAALAAHHAAIPAGKQTLGQMLEAVVKQTPLGRYEIEPGRGIWLYLKGQDANYPPSGAVAWDRAVVRAYDVRAALPHLSPEALLAHVRKQVDPGDWGRGIPAAAVFLPTMRLIVLHDEDGQRRVAAVAYQLNERYRNVPIPTKGAN